MSLGSSPEGTFGFEMLKFMQVRPMRSPPFMHCPGLPGCLRHLNPRFVHFWPVRRLHGLLRPAATFSVTLLLVARERNARGQWCMLWRRHMWGGVSFT